MDAMLLKEAGDVLMRVCDALSDASRDEVEMRLVLQLSTGYLQDCAHEMIAGNDIDTAARKAARRFRPTNDSNRQTHAIVTSLLRQELAALLGGNSDTGASAAP